MRLEINYRKKTVKNTKWRLNCALLNKQQITEKIKEEIKKKTQKQMTMKTQ